MRELTYDYYIERKMTREVWNSARDAVDHQLQEVRRDLDPTWRQIPERPKGSKHRLRADWERLDMLHQRDIIAGELENALVLPCEEKRFFDTMRVRPKWWDETQEEGSVTWPKPSPSRIWSDEHWMSTTEAAATLAVSESAVFRGIRTGRLEASRIGGFLRLKRSCIADLVLERTRVVSLDEAAASVGVSPQTIGTWVRQGTIPVARRGERAFIQVEDLRHWETEIKQLVQSVVAARELQLSKYELRGLIERGVLHALKSSRRTYFDRLEIEALAQEKLTRRLHNVVVAE